MIPSLDRRTTKTLTDVEIAHEVKANKRTFAEVARIANCTRERVRQVCEAFGVRSCYSKRVKQQARMRAKQRLASKRRKASEKKRLIRERLKRLQQWWKAEWTYESMADHANMTVPAVKALIQRARKRNRNLFPLRNARKS